MSVEFDFDHYVQQARQRLSGYRFEHVLGVCQTAMALASMQNIDIQAAAAAGLLHDIAKETPPEELRADLQRRGRPLDEEDLPFPQLWHAAAGAVWAEQDFAIGDPDIIQAIRLHPTCDRGASPLAQTLFLADYTEPTRQWEGVDDLRRLARENLHAAMAQAVQSKMAHVLAKGQTANPRALRALEAFRLDNPNPKEDPGH